MTDKQPTDQNNKRKRKPKGEDTPKGRRSALGWLAGKQRAKKTDDNQGVKAANTLAKRFPFGVLGKFILFAVAILVLVVATALVLISTDSGTRYVLDLVNKINKTDITYTSGNLVEGLQAQSVRISTGQHSQIEIEDANLKLGWRMIFDQEVVHFRSLTAKQVRYVDTKPPSGKPFDYKPIHLPIKLYASKLAVGHFVYRKATRQDVNIYDIQAKDVSFAGTQLQLKGGALNLGKSLDVQSLVGSIDFSGDFPVDAKATANIPFLTRHHFTPLDVVATGSLKQLKAQAFGRLGEGDLSLNATLQPVIKDVPMSGSLALLTTTLPFAPEQRIQVSGLSADFTGDIKKLLLNASGHISGKDIPKGDYRLVGETDFSAMQISQLRASTEAGRVDAVGDMQFSKPFQLSLKGMGRGLKVHGYLPSAAKQYMPQSLDAGLDIRLTSSDAKLTIMGDVIDQADGSKVTFDLLRGAAKQLVVQAGVSNQGMLGLPKGDYLVNMSKSGQKLTFEQARYLGEAGQMVAKGGVVLPSTKQGTINWQLNFTTQGIHPKAFAANMPLTKLVGAGKLYGSAAAQKQHIVAPALNITAELEQAGANGSKTMRTLSVLGKGQADLGMQAGKLTSLAASYTGELHTQGLPKGYVDASVSGLPQNKLTIHRFIHTSEVGHLQVAGELNQAQGLAWRLQGQMQRFNPAFLLPSYVGNLSGNFSTQGVWRDDLQLVRFDDLQLAGTLKGKPLEARGSLNLNLNLAKGANPKQLSRILSGFKADNFKLLWGSNKILANGNNRALAIAADIHSLEQLTGSVAGKLKGAIKFTDANQNNQADMAVNLKAQGLRMGGLSVEQGSVVGRLVNLGTSPSQLTAAFTGLTLGGKRFDTLQVAAKGVQNQHKAAIKLSANDISATLGVTGGFTSTKAGRFSQWQGVVDGGRVQTKLMDLLQKQPAQVKLNTNTKQLYVSAHCWVGEEVSKGRLCFTKDAYLNPAGGDVHLIMKDFAAEVFAPFLPEDMVWQGNVHGNADLIWQRGQKPKIRAIFYSDDGKLGMQAADPQDEAVTLTYKRLSLIAITQDKGLKLRFDTKTHNAGSGYIDVVIDPKSADKTINGAMVLDDIKLGIFKPFFPGIRNLSGVASLAGGMSGPLKGPQFFGNFKLKDGRVDMLGLPVNLQNIQLSSQIRGTSATLEGTFNSGLGEGKLTGNANWQQDMVAALKLTGQRLALRQPPIFYAEVNPKLDFRIQPFAKQIAIDGLVDVVKATFRPGESDPNIIKQSGDVRVVMPSEKETQKILTAAKPWRINTDIALNLKQDVYFRGFGAAIPLQGGVQVKQSGLGNTQGYGSIEVAKRVNVEAFGQSMDLTRGSVRFAGDITKPNLDIEAVKRISGSQVGLRIEGDATSPSIVVFNDAGLSEQQAMNALVTGRINNVGTTTTEAGFQNDVNNALAAAGISAGLQGTRSFTNKIGRGFGLSSLTVGATGSNDDANVNITGYLTPDLYLRYGVGVFTPINKLTLRYQMTNRVYLEATSAIEKAIDIFYNWRF